MSGLISIFLGLCIYVSISHIRRKSNLAVKLMSLKYIDVDKDSLGKSTWYLLHSLSSAYNSQHITFSSKHDIIGFMTQLSKIYPCEKCVPHFQKYLQKNPIKMERQGQFTWWLCTFHNIVNYRLKKPIYDCMDLYSNSSCSTCLFN